MKLKDVLYAVIVGLVILIGWLFFSKKEKLEKANRIIKRLRKDKHEVMSAYLSLFQKHLNSQQNIDVGLIFEIEKLKSNYNKLDFDTHIELEGIIEYLDTGKAVEAVQKLAKLVENKLKEKSENEEQFKGNRMLHNLLVSACKFGWIDERQKENGLQLKEVRNKESHELDVNEDSKTIGQCIYAGIDILYSLK